MCEPSDDWRCKDGKSLGLDVGRTNLSKDQPVDRPAGSFQQSGKGDNIVSIQCTSSLSEDDDEATESKIKAFLDEKVLFILLFLPLRLHCVFTTDLLTTSGSRTEETTDAFV